VRELALERTQVVRREIEDVFAFFGDPWNLEAITPPWLRFRIVAAPHVLEHGSLIRYRLRLFGVPIRWLTEIRTWRPPRTFTDVQRASPYRLWEHTHRFRRIGTSTEVYDHVRYAVPAGALGIAADRILVARWLDSIFAYRAQRLAELLGR
jgi:ligand-binding SRPBCC domain-containing protein